MGVIIFAPTHMPHFLVNAVQIIIFLLFMIIWIVKIKLLGVFYVFVCKFSETASEYFSVLLNLYLQKLSSI